MSVYPIDPAGTSSLSVEEKDLLKDLLWVLETTEQAVTRELETLADERNSRVSVAARSALGRIRSGTMALSEMIGVPPRG